MKKYAIIQIQGKQYQVFENDQLVVDRLSEDVEEQLSIEQVLLYNDGKNVLVGQPFVNKVKVILKVIKHILADKIRVAKYKAKSRYRKVRGHRQQQSVVEVMTIQS